MSDHPSPETADVAAADAARAELRFTRAEIRGIVTTVGAQCIDFADEADRYGLEAREIAKLRKVVGLDKRQVVADDSTTTVDLCDASARRLLAGCQCAPESISALLLVTQSPDHAAPSSAIALQHRLGLPVTSMAFDMRLGCSGFVYGLSVAYSLVESGLPRVLLCVGDVASRLVAPDDHTITPIMGDAGAAILIERGNSNSSFQLYSDGAGGRALMIPNSGLRRVAEDEDKGAFMQMAGAAVFSFTLQRVPAMIDAMLAFTGCTVEDIDHFILHQPNRYILQTLQKRLSLPAGKLPMDTQSRYGNLNAASIPGTLSGFLSETYSTGKRRSLFAGFGIGLSWAACVVDTDTIFAPPAFTGVD